MGTLDLKVWLLFLTAIVFLVQCNGSGIFYSGEERDCAVIFSGYNLTGHKRTIKNGERIPDLSTVSLINQKFKVELDGFKPAPEVLSTWNGSLSSILIQPNCHIQLCNATYLEGSCSSVDNTTKYFKVIIWVTKTLNQLAVLHTRIRTSIWFRWMGK